MKKTSLPLGFLTATQFASDCKTDGLPIPVEHTLWLIEKKFIMPIAKINGVDYYSEYQIYILDLIEDRRLQSLNYPKGPGVTRTGETLKSYYPETTWQNYLLSNKNSITEVAKQWNPIAKLLLEIQPLHNDFLHKAIIKKEGFGNPEIGEKERIDIMLQGIIESDGPIKANSILKKYPDISESILRLWKNNRLPAAAVKHNPILSLGKQRPDLLDIFLTDKTEPSTIFTRGNPMRLSNLYLRMIFYLNFFISCLNEGKEPEVKNVFTVHYLEKLCAACRHPFIPNPTRGGKIQKLCGKAECDAEYRRRQEKERRGRKA